VKTEIFDWRHADATERADIITRAAVLLSAGELVAYPTETVYGLAAAGMDADATARIFDVKGRPLDRPLLLAVRDLAAARRIVTDIPDRAHRLAERFWPGPLSLVMSARPEVPREVTAGTGSVGLRCPAHPVARALVREAGPITSPSANLSGRPSPRTADAVRGDLDGRIAAIIDAGKTPGGRESTVVDVRHGISVLREGAIASGEIFAALEEDDEARVQADTVLFVCTGNTCRSPVAAALLRSHLAERGLSVASAGTHAFPGAAASDGSREAAREVGLNLSGHRSRGLEDVCWSRVLLVVAMTQRHAAAVREFFDNRDVANRPPVETVSSLTGGGDVPDPLGGAQEHYRETLCTLRAAIPEVLAAVDRQRSEGGRS